MLTLRSLRLFFSFFMFFILFLEATSMSRESDDNLSSINSAYTGKYVFTFHLYFYYAFICYFNLATAQCVSFNLFP